MIQACSSVAGASGRDGQRRRHRGIKPSRRIDVGDRQTGDHAQQHPVPQRARVAPGKPRPRQPDVQTADLGQRARGVHPPKRGADRVLGRRLVGQHRQRPVHQAGARLQPPVGGTIIRKADMAHATDQQSDKRQRNQRKQRHMQRGRQQGRQIKQRGTDKNAGHGQGRPERGPNGLEQDSGARQQPATGQAAQQRRRITHLGSRSRSHSASIGWRSRITDQRPPSTHTSAAMGRAL